MRQWRMLLVLGLALGLGSCGSKEDDSGGGGGDGSGGGGGGTAGAASSVQNEVNLRLNLKKGDVYRFCQRESINIKETGKSILAGQMKYWVEMDCTVKCLDVYPDGTMLLEKSWDAGRAEGSGTGGLFEWNTQVEGKRVIPNDLKRYGKLAGRTIKLEITPAGEILWVENIEAIADAILFEKGVKARTMDKDEYEAMQQGVMEELKYSREHMFECGLDRYPNKVLKSGQRWEIEKEAATTREGKEIQKLTFNQVKGGVASFDVLLSMRAGTDSMDSSFVAKVDSAVDAWANGQMNIHAESGVILSMKVKGDVSIQQDIHDRLWDVEYEKDMEGSVEYSLKQIN